MRKNSKTSVVVEKAMRTVHGRHGRRSQHAARHSKHRKDHQMKTTPTWTSKVANLFTNYAAIEKWHFSGPLIYAFQSMGTERD